MLSGQMILAMFLMLTISTGLFFLSKRVKVPYTVMLVIAGILLASLANLPFLNPYIGFMSEATLSPELLFYLFLPVLIFESAYNMNVRKMLDSSWTIISLAVFGMLISTFLIGGALYYVMPLIGFDMPLVMALLFGAIISSTDPVAVLALFKEYGAPKRLTMIFEGESLFNDGTAVAVFLVLLAVIADGFHGTETFVEGIFMFLIMVALGVLFGLLMATLFSQALKFTRSNEFATVTLLMISAHLVFIVSEMINEHSLLGPHIHISAIIATTVSSLFLGNYSRHILKPATGDYLMKFVEHSAFIANSLVFILAGALFASSNINLSVMWGPIIVTIFVVIIIRAISVLIPTTIVNKLHVEEPIPFSWQLLLSWGSLRGALAIILALLVPENIQIEGWNNAIGAREFILALTVGCILATLFVKAPLMNKVMEMLKINEPDPLRLARKADLDRYYLLSEMERFNVYMDRGFIDSTHYEKISHDLMHKYAFLDAERDDIRAKYGKRVFDRAISITAISIEERVLDNLYTNMEVSEPVYRRLKGKLNMQLEHAEYAYETELDSSIYTDRKDIFDKIAQFTQSLFEKNPTRVEELSWRLQYYRAQIIMARKALKVLGKMQDQYQHKVFYETSYVKIVARYEKFKKNSGAKYQAWADKYNEELQECMSDLSLKSLNASGIRALEYLRHNGITTEDSEHDIRDDCALGKQTM